MTTTTISATQVKELREVTGAGIMDCREALQTTGGDVQKAMDWLRQKGMAKAEKKASRVTSEGRVGSYIHGAGRLGVLVELNCETDFVAKNAKFVALGEKAVAIAASSGATSPEDLEAAGFTLADDAAAIGEKLQVRRIGRVAGEHVEVYLHRTSRDLPPQVGVLVATDVAGAAVAHDVAMHIAAYSPLYLSREDVPAETLESERRIAEETARNEGKAEKALPKIVEGRMNGFFKDNVLLDQAYARDPKMSVGQVVAASGGTVTGFVRFRVGA